MDEQKSVIVVEFSSQGSSEFSVALQGVTYNQILLVASYLEMKAKSLILKAEEQMAQEQQQKLMVPKNEILLP